MKLGYIILEADYMYLYCTGMYWTMESIHRADITLLRATSFLLLVLLLFLGNSHPDCIS